MANVVQCPACGADLSSASANGVCPRCGAAEAVAQAQPTVAESFPERIFADQLTEPIEHARSSAPNAPGLPPSLSGYMIIGPPKRGGMGTVWPAKQLGTKRTVAIKILGTQHLTDAGQARFIREVELSAQLQHPNIARIYDSGVHQGDYFYAMEMIDGLPLDQYVAKRKCSQKQILELMRLVCQAVQHAHVRGVIHCDLKPANILVSEDGQPHVLDFGLARLASTSPDGLTENGSAPGTVSWMSPEQAAGRLDLIDIRSDVYSLGKMLYQLLTGQPPHRLDGPLTQVLHRIATEEIRPPREVCPALSRELSAVLLKALKHDSEERYASAGELARDIASYQSGQPLIAVGNSTAYQLRKWVIRHRLGVGIATALFAVLIGSGAFWEARIRRERTNKQLVAEFTQSLLDAIDPSKTNGANMTPVLMQHARLLSERFKDDPLAQAEIAEKLGNTLFTFGLLEPAEEQLRTASTLLYGKLGLSNPQTLAVKERLAQICRERGKFQEAEEICREILHAKTDKWGEANRQTLRAAIALGQVLENRSSLGDEPQTAARAEKLLRDTLEQCRKQLGNRDPVTLEAQAALIPVLRDQGDAKLAEADELSRATLDARNASLGRKHRQTIESKRDRASVLAAMGKARSAEDLYREALADALREAGWSSPLGPATEEHPDLLIWWNDLAVVMAMQGEFAEAQLIYDDILPASIRSRGLSHPFNVIIRKNLAATLAGQGLWGRAENEFIMAAKLHGEVWGPDSPGTLNLLDYQAWTLTAQKKWRQAAEIYERTLKGRLNKLPPDDPGILASKKRLEIARSHLSGGAGGAATRPVP